MNTAEKRAELEAALWRVTGSTPDTAVTLVDTALEAADRYAQAYAAEFASAVLDGATRDHRTAERRQVLADALRGESMTALAVAGIIAGTGLAEIGSAALTVITDITLAVGSLVMLCAVIFGVLFLLARQAVTHLVILPPETEHAPTQPSGVLPVIDDALPLFFKHSPVDFDAEIEKWLKEDGRNG